MKKDLFSDFIISLIIGGLVAFIFFMGAYLVNEVITKEKVKNDKISLKETDILIIRGDSARITWMSDNKQSFIYTFDDSVYYADYTRNLDSLLNQ